VQRRLRANVAGFLGQAAAFLEDLRGVGG